MQKIAKLKVLLKEIVTPRISHQWVVQEVISSWTNIDSYKKVYILEGGLTPYLTLERN